MSYSLPPPQLMSDRTRMGAEFQYFTPIEPSTALMILDSDQRTSGESFQFVCQLHQEVPRCRQIQLKRVILPRLGNVTPNTTMQIKHDLGTTAVFTLPTGLYNTSSFSNMLTATINAQFVIDGIADTVTVSFDQLSRSYTISSVGANNFFIVDSCTLILYGDYLAPFPSEPLANVPSTTSITSGVAAMLPFRYVLIISNALAGYNKLRSITSSATTSNNIIGCIDVCTLFPDDIYDIAQPYSGVYQTLNLDNSPILRTEQSNVQAPSIIDIRLQDSYGRYLDDLYPDDAKLSICLELQMTY